MKRIFQKSTQTERVVFRATIELNSDYRELNSSEEVNRLTPKKKYYYFIKEDKKEEASYEDIKKTLTKSLDADLLREVNELLDTPILSVKVNSVNEGSLEIIFTIITNVATSVITELIKYVAKNLLIRALNNRYGYFFDVSVDCISQIEELRDMKCCGYLPVNFNNVNNTKRDEFFLLLSYILCTNIALMAVIFYFILKNCH